MCCRTRFILSDRRLWSVWKKRRKDPQTHQEQNQENHGCSAPGWTWCREDTAGIFSPVPHLCYQRSQQRPARRYHRLPKNPSLKGKRWMPCHTSQSPLSVLNSRCADVGGEERVPFGLRQADWFGDCFICFSLAPACQVLPLIILICPRGAAPRPAFLHNSASSFCVFIMIKRRKTILRPQVRIRGWYLCPILGYAVGQII